MKYTKLFLFVTLSSLSLSCVKEIGSEQSVAADGISEITASFADGQTKTVLGSDEKTILWSPNDEISVFYGTSGMKFTSINTQPDEMTIFASNQALVFGGTESSTSRYLWAVYPYSSDNASDKSSVTLTVPATQTAVAGSFGRGAYPSIGRSKDTNIAFYNVCGGIRFSLTQSGIAKIVVKGNNNETIAGKVKVTFNSDGLPQVSGIVSGEKAVTLSAPNGGEFQTGKWYYVSILPTTFSKGVSFELVKKSPIYEIGKKEISSSCSIKRSVFASTANLDSGVSFMGDLSKYGTANCYIVPASGDYKFNATVKGGSTEAVGYLVSAEVLWESFGTSVTPKVGDIIKTVSFENGYVKFSTPSTLNNGNAVIAVKDASGNILWSWHIWVCKDFDPSKTAQVYNNNAGTMMDRNLGAISATPGAAGTCGLLYQWGRKDPFIGGSDHNNSAASTVSWPAAVSSDSSNGTIAYAVAHPTTFIKYNSNNYDWYFTGSSSTDNTRWQTIDKTKGIYDPCPQGWRVPDGGSNGVWSKAFGSSSYYSSGPWDSTNYGMNFGSGNGKSSSMQLGGSSTICYPAAGFRDDDDGSLIGVGNGGSYWSCTPNDYNAYYLYFYRNGYVYPSYSNIRAYGLSVRCLSE